MLTQIEYITYTHYIDEIKLVEQCTRKKQLSRVMLLEGRFVKSPYIAPQDNQKNLSLDNLKLLEERVTYINNIHRRLKAEGEDCAPLAAEYYNTHYKTIAAWNALFHNMQIDTPPRLNPTFSETTADKKALDRYCELLTQYPKLRREGDLNDYTKGTYQIIYDHIQIASIQKEVYERLYSKAISKGLSPSEANELAANFSRPGVVCEDHYWLWIRDAVISPQGYRHTYNRMVWKSDLDRPGGVASLPVNGDKIVIELAFRHATQTWEFEMPRGASNEKESSIETAKREILEETGCVTDQLVQLGTLTPDTGLTASIIPIFIGKVVEEKTAAQDQTEAIKGKYAFTYTELMEGYKRGYIEVELNGSQARVPLRDPFLAYALLMGRYQKIL